MVLTIWLRVGGLDDRDAVRVRPGSAPSATWAGIATPAVRRLRTSFAAASLAGSAEKPLELEVWPAKPELKASPESGPM